MLNLLAAMNAALPLSLQHLLPIPLRERLSGRYSGIWQQELTWQSGQRIFIQAPSGTGKTTLVHMLYGLRKDYNGVIRWGSEELGTMNAESLGDMRRSSVSVVFQDMRLFPALTAWENLEVKRALTNTVAVAEVRDMMMRLGIADRADQAAATLSYAEQQRVAIIRALLQPFVWLLMDEPFSHLDEANTALAATLIDEVVLQNDAAFLLADLNDNAHFLYTQKLVL